MARIDVNGRSQTMRTDWLNALGICRVSPCWPLKKPRVGLATAAREHGSRMGSDGNLVDTSGRFQVTQLSSVEEGNCAVFLLAFPRPAFSSIPFTMHNIKLTKAQKQQALQMNRDCRKKDRKKLRQMRDRVENGVYRASGC